MGLIQAAVNSVTGVLSDQYKEYFYCEALSTNVLAVKGKKRTSRRSMNQGDDNIITSGSVIAIADGQCMMIVEQGRVIEVCAETGHFVYDASTEPSIFSGNLGQSIIEVFESLGGRFTFGGQPAKDQRVYYFNTKEIIGNKYGTPSPIPFRVVDQRAGIDIDIAIRCFGEYSYHISNPLLFYKNVCGNVTAAYTRDQLDGQLKSELLTALQPAFARISEMGVRYSSLPAHTEEFAQALNETLSNKWRDMRGIEIVSVGVSSVKANEEDETMIKEMQKTAAYANPTLGAAAIVSAQADAMRSAANNTAGAAVGFMGLNMAAQAGGVDTRSLYQMSQQQSAVSADSWICSSCGKPAIGNFCPECGTRRPATADSWTCSSCGAVNQGKFCSECGAKRPLTSIATSQCPQCGWTITDPSNPPKFCPECGKAFS